MFKIMSSVYIEITYINQSENTSLHSLTFKKLNSSVLHLELLQLFKTC